MQLDFFVGRTFQSSIFRSDPEWDLSKRWDLDKIALPDKQRCTG